MWLESGEAEQVKNGTTSNGVLNDHIGNKMEELKKEVGLFAYLEGECRAGISKWMDVMWLVF